MKIRVIIEWDRKVGAYSATCPELNFVSSCGITREEAISNLREAIKVLLTPIPDNLLSKSRTAEVLLMAL